MKDIDTLSTLRCIYAAYFTKISDKNGFYLKQMMILLRDLGIMPKIIH